MENNKASIIEFNGLPGCGKSTLLSGIYNELLNQGTDVYSLETNDTFIDKKNWIKNFYLLFRYSGLKLIFYSILFTAGIKPFKLSRFKLLKTLFLYYISYIQAQKSLCEHSIILVSQGYLQSIISIVFTGCINRKKIYKLLDVLFKKIPNVMIINCELTPDIAKKRIQERNEIQGRFDRMESNILLKNLEVQERTFFTLRDTLSSFEVQSLSVSMENAVSANVKTIVSQVNRKENK